MIRLRDIIIESFISDKVWYHGSPSGDLRGGTTGLHLGTFKAAKQALEARIGVPVEGEWDGTREYGKTLLCGQKSLKAKGQYPTGFNVDVGDDDFYPTKSPEHTTYLSLNMKPAIKAYKLVCPVMNKRAYTDNFANHLMDRLKRRGQTGNQGYQYKNDGEDYGSISIVVPNGDCVKEV